MHSTRALTLTELIIASVLVGIAMLGIFSADFAMRRMEKSFSVDANLNMQTNALADAIRADVRKVHGYIGTSYAETGVYVDISQKTFCFRYDMPIAGQYTPQDYADDQWSCYTQIPSLTRLYRCILNAPGSCNATDIFMGELVADQFTNTAIVGTGPSPTSPQVTADAATGEFAFNMLLVSRKTSSAGAATNAGVLINGTEDNPQVMVNIHENVGGF